MELLEYINEHFDEIECELNGDVYKEPKKHKRNFCIDCNLEMLIDYEKSTLVCTKCGVFEYYPVHVQSYNHTMRYSRRKCIYKRSDNFKVILDQFFYGLKQRVPDDVMKAIRNEICNRDNILYNYTIPLTIPILECILKRNKMMKYKNTVSASGKLTHSAGRLAAGLRLNAGSTAGRKLLLLREFSTFVLRYCL